MPSIFDLQAPLSEFTTVSSKDVGGALTVEETVAGLVLSAPASGIAFTSPSAEAIFAALKASKKGTAFDFIIRSTTNTVTFTAASGVTITGTATVASGKVGQFRGVVTAGSPSPAVTFYRLGTSDV